MESTTINIRLSLLPWAIFRRTSKAAIKLHILLDLRGSIPTVVIVTYGKVHEVNILDQITIEPGAICILDRGYLDFILVPVVHQTAKFFIIKTKNSIWFTKLYARNVNQTIGVRCDQTII